MFILVYFDNKLPVNSKVNIIYYLRSIRWIILFIRIIPVFVDTVVASERAVIRPITSVY